MGTFSLLSFFPLFLHRIECDHPILRRCEDHWKARQLLQQVIDNAIDEINLSRKRVSAVIESFKIGHGTDADVSFVHCASPFVAYLPLFRTRASVQADYQITRARLWNIPGAIQAG